MNNQLTIAASELDKRAQAVAEVHQTHEDLRRALDYINKLKAENARQADQILALQQDRRRLSAEMHTFRDKCIELATCVANIGLQTITANNIVMTVRELTEASTEEHGDDNEA